MRTLILLLLPSIALGLEVIVNGEQIAADAVDMHITDSRIDINITTGCARDGVIDWRDQKLTAGRWQFTATGSPLYAGYVTPRATIRRCGEPIGQHCDGRPMHWHQNRSAGRCKLTPGATYILHCNDECRIVTNGRP